MEDGHRAHTLCLCTGKQELPGPLVARRSSTDSNVNSTSSLERQLAFYRLYLRSFLSYI